MPKPNLAEGSTMSGLCACGCGQETLISPSTHRRMGYVKGQPRRFLRGHNRRVGEFTVCTKCGSQKPNGRRCQVCLTRYTREYRQRAPEAVREKARKRSRAYARQYRTVHRQKAWAHWTFNNARRRGEIEPPETCQRCGGATLLHGHHDDYSLPLDVTWLCAPCHRAEHMKVAA